MGGERPPGLNFIDTLRTIEKSKETIVNRANKVMGPASGLFRQFLARTHRFATIQNVTDRQTTDRRQMTHRAKGSTDSTVGQKPTWILMKQETVSGSGISWAICKCAPCHRQITVPAPHHSVFLQAGCSSYHPTNSIEALKNTNKQFATHTRVI